ncbi:hypothetical protein Dxin01_00088 [Deinococcus xinjiangensis]|uniref:Uncharacterized protein n=1 Tax=Deinococcus xinjiangensis TaxID=457454 RepID=A0ABP9V502_9DEIO
MTLPEQAVQYVKNFLAAQGVLTNETFVRVTKCSADASSITFLRLKFQDELVVQYLHATEPQAAISVAAGIIGQLEGRLIKPFEMEVLE